MQALRTHHGRWSAFLEILDGPIPAPDRAPAREGRVSRTYRLRLSKLNAAKRALGASTSTEAIEMALDLAVFQRELIEGTRAMFGIRITSPDSDR